MRARVINNGGATSGGSTVLRSLFSTPFYVDYDAVSSFQLGLPVSPPFPPIQPRPHVALARFTHYRSIASPTLQSRIGFSLLLPNPYTQSAPFGPPLRPVFSLYSPFSLPTPWDVDQLLCKILHLAEFATFYCLHYIFLILDDPHSSPKKQLFHVLPRFPKLFQQRA